MATLAGTTVAYQGADVTNGILTICYFPSGKSVNHFGSVRLFLVGLQGCAQIWFANGRASTVAEVN